jgi:hypothetical protein
MIFPAWSGRLYRSALTLVPQPPSAVLCSLSEPFDTPLDSLDLPAIRLAFGRLFDRAANEVFRLGRDLDEVTFERFLRCRVNDGGGYTAPAEPLSNFDRFVATVRRAMPCHLSEESHAVCISSLEVRVLIAGDPLRRDA